MSKHATNILSIEKSSYEEQFDPCGQTKRQNMASWNPCFQNGQLKGEHFQENDNLP